MGIKRAWNMLLNCVSLQALPTELKFRKNTKRGDK